MPFFEQMMMGEEPVLEGTSCEASIDWFPCECNVCPDGEMVEMTCESIGVMSTCIDMGGGVFWGGSWVEVMRRLDQITAKET